MNKIEKLMGELCPEGVRYFALDELFDLKNGYTPSKANSQFWTDGTVPWFRMDDIRKNGRVLSDSLQYVSKSAAKGGRYFEGNSLVVATTATIGEHALVQVPFLANQRFTILTIKPRFRTEYLAKFGFYVGFLLSRYCQENTNVSGFASVDMDKFRKFKFPLPPLRVQKEIVSILDKFTELEAELEAEFKARSDFYRWTSDSVFRSLDTDRVSSNNEEFHKFNVVDAPFCTLEQLGTFHRGGGIRKADLQSSGIPAIHYGEVYTQYSVWTDVTKSFVSEEVASKSSKGLPGDVLITISDVTPHNVGRAVTWLGDNPIAVGGDLLIFRHSLHPNYVSHFFSSSLFSEQKLTRVTGATVRHLSASDLKSIQIPVPSMESQVMIAETLDKAHRIIDSREGGIFNEIQARRKQCGYYRNKLLTFKELDVA